MLFEHKMGILPSDVISYYQGDEERFMMAKSYIGTLKVILPHIFAVALFAMVLLHFIIFTKYKTQVRALSFLLYGAIFLEIFTPFGIIYGFELFAYVKLLSFLLLELLILYILWILFSSIVYE